MKKLLLFASILFVVSSHAQDLKVRRDWMSPSHEVFGVAHDSINNRVFISGNFNYVGMNTPYGTELDTGALNGAPTWDIDSPWGAVEHAAPDGFGGWFISGSFVKVGDSARRRIAHIGSNGQVMPTFGENGLGGTAHTMKRAGDTLYIGGWFDDYGNARQYLAMTDTIQGITADNFPEPNGPSAYVSAITSDGMGGWYLGGNFTMMGDSTRSNLAHVDLNGNVTAWNPNVNGTITSIVLDGSTVYIGGTYTTIDGQARTNLAAVDAITGAVSAWTPDPDDIIYMMKIYNGKLFVSGSFMNISGVSRTRIASYDLSTQLITAFSPNVQGTVYDFDFYGTDLYMCGSFQWVNTLSRYKLAAVNETTGASTSWDPQIGGLPYALDINGTSVFVGGQFSSVGGQARLNLTELDVTTGFPSPWNPAPNSAIYDIGISTNKIYVSGAFSSIAGQNQDNVASFSLTTGALTSWNPYASDRAYAFGFYDDKVMVGGPFGEICRYMRSNAMAIDLNTGLPTDWRPDPDDVVEDLVIYGDTIILGGSFVNIGGTSKLRLGAVNKFDGTAYSGWTCQSNSTIFSFKKYGDTLFVGGSFSNLGSSSRDKLAMMNPYTAVVNNTWAPDPVGVVYDVGVDANNVYIGGYITSVSGLTRTHLASVDISTGIATSFSPVLDDNVRELTVIANGLYVIGDFELIDGVSRNSLARVDVVTGAIHNWDPKPHLVGFSQMNSVTSANGKLYVGGEYQQIGGEVRDQVAALDATTGQLTSWAPTVSDAVFVLRVFNNQLFLGGEFTTIESQTRWGIASYDLNSMTLTSLDVPAWSNSLFSPSVYELHGDGNTLYVGGDFGSLGGLSRQRIGSINLTTGTVNSWNPGANEDVETIQTYNNSLYVGGYFTSIGGQSRNKIGQISTTTGAATSWNPGSDVEVNSLKLVGNTAYVGGKFFNLGGQPSSFLGAVDLTTGLATSWAPAPNEHVNDLEIMGDHILVAGQYSGIAGTDEQVLTAIDKNTGAVSLFFDQVGGSEANEIELGNNMVFVGGNFNYIGGRSHKYFGAFEGCLAVTASVNNISCYGLTDGSIDITLNGATGPVVYDWNTGSYNSEDISGLLAGTYTVNVSDSVGCSTTRSYTINEPAILTSNGTYNDITCNGDADGGIDLTVIGGTPGYTYNWNSGTYSTEDLTNLGPGAYEITVSDSNGCQTTSNFVIEEFPTITTSFTSSDVSCPGMADGIIDYTATGGTGTFSYSWNSGTYTTEDLTNVTGGNYTLVLADSMGCTVFDTVVIFENPAIDVTTSLSGITITANNITSGVQYQWVNCDTGMSEINGATNQNYTPTVNGNYAVVVNENGCIDTSYCTNIAIIGLEGEISGEFSIFPNPFYDHINITYYGSSEPTRVSLYNSNGKLIFERNERVDQIEINDLPAGSYYLEVQFIDTKRKVLIRH